MTTIQEVGVTQYERDQTKRNIILLWSHPHFPDGPDAIHLFADHIPCCCLSCHREYDDLTRAEVAAMDRGDGCPSDDCPSHWEEKGLTYPG